MKSEKVIGGYDSYILMSALWAEKRGEEGVTYSRLLSDADGFAKMTYSHDDLGCGFARLETAGLIQVTEERIFPTELAKQILAEVNSVRTTTDYVANPANFGGNVHHATRSTSAYDEHDLVRNELRKKFSMPQGEPNHGMPRHPLYSEQRYREAQEENHRAYLEWKKDYVPSGYYANSVLDKLSPVDKFEHLFDDEHGAPIPDDWLLIATDVTGSTKAIEEGR